MSAPGGQRVDVVIPPMGWAEVQICVWFAEPGDRVYAGDRLVEVIAGGASFDVAAPASGKLTERTSFASDVVRPGQVVGTLIADAE